MVLVPQARGPDFRPVTAMAQPGWGGRVNHVFFKSAEQGNAVPFNQAAHVGADKLYILSAGWGLVRSDFLLPDYNITFSPHADRGVRRFKTDEGWPDLMQLPRDTEEPVICFGGQAYVRFFTRLTSGIAAPRHAFRRVAIGQEGETTMQGGVRIHDYGTDRRTNWHHDCARDFMNGKIGI